MIKKLSYIFQCLSLLLLAVFTAGCREQQQPVFNSCQSNNDKCINLIDAGTSVHINTDVLLVETVYQLNIKTEKKLHKVYLQGINMKMGQVPIVFSELNGEYLGQFSLGMCSEPEMKWQLVLEYSNATPSYFEFLSYWSKP